MTRDEFSQRVSAATGTLYRVSCGLLRSEADREDAVQEAILKAWERLDTLRQEQYFETWLVRILINECRTIGRDRSRFVSIDEVRAQEQAAPPESRELREAIMGLSPDLRLAVILHYIEGYEIREIAPILGVPEGTVKSRLFRARKMLKVYLEEAQEL